MGSATEARAWSTKKTTKGGVSVEDLNDFIMYPGEPMPVPGKWYWVAFVLGDVGQRGMYTGTDPTLPPFVDANFRAVGLSQCWWRELRPGE
jgi:hypothetical protein